MNIRTTPAAILRNLSLAACLALLIIPAAAQQIQTDPQVSYEIKHDVSLPLGYLARIAPKPKHGFVEMIEPERNLGLTVGLPGEDTAVQDVYLPTVHTTQVLNIEGTREDQGNAQVPDTNGSAGATQFVEITNFDYEVFDKATGKVILKPTNTNTIFAGFGGACEGTNPGDPVVVWDKLAQRWLVTYFNYTTDLTLCIAVSTTADSTGTYNRYSYGFGNTLPDYPKYAVWPDAYYASVNAFGSGAAEPCAFDRNAMLHGKSKAAMICFTPNNNNFSFLPSDLDGATLPPTGAPNHYVELGNSTNALDEYDFHVDFAHPKKSTFTGPHSISVPSYSLACGGGYCIPQPAPGEQVESLGDRLLFRLGYRNFGDHESMVVAHAVTPGKASTAVSAMRWYELRATPVGGKFSVYQAGTFQNKSTSLWMGSAAMDKQGDIAMGMSASSNTVKPSVWYTGRLATDPLGKMEAPTIAAKGTAVEIGDSARWGDYSSMSIDPSDDCTFWYTQMYYNKKHGGTASVDWSTRMVAFKFDSCK
jgi:hypothetical protein